MRVGDGADGPAEHRPMVEFSIRDDGVGFDAGPTFATVGLMNIIDRVEAVGGVVTIDSVPGEGTRISGNVPLPTVP